MQNSSKHQKTKNRVRVAFTLRTFASSFPTAGFFRLWILALCDGGDDGDDGDDDSL